jgi:hypothetical protein
MKATKPYRYPLRLAAEDKQDVDALVRRSGRSINDVLVLSLRRGLPLIREALCPPGERLTTVQPLSEATWRRIFSRKDELDEVSGAQLRAAQSQRKPS